MTKQPHVWVVELRAGANWLPISRCIATYASAVRLMETWEKQWGNHQFRVAKYVRVEPKKGRKT